MLGIYPMKTVNTFSATKKKKKQPDWVTALWITWEVEGPMERNSQERVEEL